MSADRTRHWRTAAIVAGVVLTLGALCVELAALLVLALGCGDGCALGTSDEWAYRTQFALSSAGLVLIFTAMWLAVANRMRAAVWTGAAAVVVDLSWLGFVTSI